MPTFSIGFMVSAQGCQTGRLIPLLTSEPVMDLNQNLLISMQQDHRNCNNVASLVTTVHNLRGSSLAFYSFNIDDVAAGPATP